MVRVPGQDPPPPCKVCGEGKHWTKGYCRNCHPSASQRGCLDCLSWGPVRIGGLPAFQGSWCYACSQNRRRYPVGPCRFCHREAALLHGVCRLCRHEAGRRAGSGHQIRPLDRLKQHPSQQLFFAEMLRHLQLGGLRRVEPRPPPPAPASWGPPVGVQGVLFDLNRDLSLFVRKEAAVCDDPRLFHAHAVSARLADRGGWSHHTVLGVNRALTAVLGCRPDDGQQIRMSELRQLGRRKMSAERTAEVLNEMGLLHDDTPDALAAWVDRQLDGLAPRIEHEVRHWIDFLRGRLPRSKSRPVEGVYRELAYLLPPLRAWSDRYDSLREVVRDDIKAVAFARGQDLDYRTHQLTALRSLFRRLKRDQLIFRNPTTPLSLPGRDRLVAARPLPDEELRRAVSWAAGRPERTVLVGLAIGQALRPVQMRRLLVVDVNLGERMLVVEGQPWPLHDLTFNALTSYLDHRRTRWPNTRNPHLLITQQTAAEIGPVSKSWSKIVMKPLGITLVQLRQDRLLDELIAHGPDPLHFMTVFGCSDTTALRFLRVAEQLLGHDPRFRR
ncbi:MULTISPECIES: hypothetical protein [unclassified Actinoplanes]|uniref:hypothetical protein n=1 Tax=unclassified Actinoplanes TaxID=2626549 RepID=UPI0012BA62DF|nr:MULTISPECIES: hypothetical protein [unclassified Actinoplanes]